MAFTYTTWACRSPEELGLTSQACPRIRCVKESNRVIKSNRINFVYIYFESKKISNESY